MTFCAPDRPSTMRLAVFEELDTTLPDNLKGSTLAAGKLAFSSVVRQINARVILAKTRHGPHSSKIVVCIVCV